MKLDFSNNIKKKLQTGSMFNYLSSNEVISVGLGFTWEGIPGSGWWILDSPNTRKSSHYRKDRMLETKSHLGRNQYKNHKHKLRFTPAQSYKRIGGTHP